MHSQSVITLFPTTLRSNFMVQRRTNAPWWPLNAVRFNLDTSRWPDIGPEMKWFGLVTSAMWGCAGRGIRRAGVHPLQAKRSTKSRESNSRWWRQFQLKMTISVRWNWTAKVELKRSSRKWWVESLRVKERNSRGSNSVLRFSRRQIDHRP